MKKIKVIYNPTSGTKKKIIGKKKAGVGEIKEMLMKYQIDADYEMTKRPNHAIEIAKDCIKKGYEMVIAAGGDGTVSEVANALVGTDVILGIIPLGTFMNIARMLSIPYDNLELAAALLKISRIRKIDVGMVTKLSGEKLSAPHYFIEGGGVGLDAEIAKYFLEAEQGDLKSIFKIVKPILTDYSHKGEIILDGKVIPTKATLITVSNGPFTYTSLKLAPEAKLNDHRLTVRLYYMSKLELASYLLNLWANRDVSARKIKTYQAKKIVIKTEMQRLVHVDARVYGEAPIEFSVYPNALNVVCGFPVPGEYALNKRNFTF